MSQKITIKNNSLQIPDNPIIPFIEGDGIGPDIMKATQAIIDTTIKKTYNGNRAIHWKEIFAGEKAMSTVGQWLPDKTLADLKEYIVSLKGPLTTPVGGGIRSLNVTIRQKLNLYACIRPVRYFQGVPSPLREPEKTDVVIFRENTEDVYSGLEWQANSKEATDLISFLKNNTSSTIATGSGIGIKPISPTATKNLVRKAILYAIENKRPSVTLVHKGNIMKFTEGAFKQWGYELAKEEFADKTITEDDLYEKYNGKPPAGKIIINDRIADNMFQQILLHPEHYSILATLNLNGDYLSDACAAQVGGLGMAPGANIGDFVAVFEATHGTAPKYTNMNKANPGSLLLSAVMMLEYLSWQEAADKIVNALSKTILQKKVTYDLARNLDGAKELGTKEFAEAIISNL